MPATLRELAQLVAGQLVGEGEIPIHGAGIITCAGPGEITFADSSKFAPQLAISPAAAVLVGPGFVPVGIPYVVVPDVHGAFAIIVKHFRPQRQARAVGISPAAQISATARLSEHVQVHPLATIGDDVEIGPRTVIHSGVRLLDGCKIGADVTIFPNAVLYENTMVGDRVLIHAGVVLGAYGFGYTQVIGQHKLCSQLGYVEVGDDVEIGANTTIDRGSYGPTLIGNGTKIDNQVQVGHNCRIGRHNLLCSQVGIAGSCTTEDYVVMAGQAGIADHLHIGAGTAIGAKSGLMHDALPGKRYFGIPAMEAKQFFRIVSLTHHLPELRKQLHEVQRAIIRLAGSGDSQSLDDLDSGASDIHSDAA